MRGRAIGLAIGLLCGVAGGAGSAPSKSTPAAAAPEPVPCPQAVRYRHCLERCTPANLMLLPCMAVGANAMPACRDREIGLCVETCRRRFC